MTDQIEQDIVAYLDGEMPAAARQALEARIQADPVLEAAVADHRQLLSQLQRAYPAGPDKSFDDQELAALDLLDSSPVIDLSHARAAKTGQRGWRAIAWVAMAASLVGGIAVGRLAFREQGFVTQRNDELLASAELDRALDAMPDGGKGAVRIGLSFRGEAGLCRTFRLDNGYAGIGCRSDDRWQVPVLVRSSASSPSSPDFELAGGDFPPAVMQEVDARIAGSPLTPVQVDEARRRNWR
ncbi:anti-sigma factor [Sphingobium sp. EM0848]|uniref:anti-sigma factor family protein n=1 Tax=Sphingobium sp. EM0848 TaxID=2743473 RepID=UPI00159C4880|nr:hypothetical protein [Sphingobium sp. EM0848]